MDRSKEKFTYELEKARENLANQGRETTISDSINGKGGLASCDFELPYSSPPKITSSKWS